MVVRRFQAGVFGEGPERGPGFEQVARESAAALVARRLAGVLARDRLELALQLADRALQSPAVAGVLKDLPGKEQPVTDRQTRFAERLLGPKTLGVRGEIPDQVRLIPNSG